MLRLVHLRTGLAALLRVLGLSLTLPACIGFASAQQAATTAPTIGDGTFELINWPPSYPDHKHRQICTVAGSSVTCVGHYQIGALSVSSEFVGTVHGSTFVGSGFTKGSDRQPACSYRFEARDTATFVLAADGILTLHSSNGVANYTDVSGACAAKLPRTVPLPEGTATGTWRLMSGAEPAVTAAPGTSVTGGGKVSVRRVGDAIYVTDESGQERVVTVLLPTKVAAPLFQAPTVGGEAKALERFVVTHVFEASYGHLPPKQRSDFVSGMAMPSEVAGQAALATLEAGESAANWVANNPAEASLLALGTAVSLAFPVSAFASPAVATGGAAILRGVVGSAMVAGTTGFVQKLMGNVFTNQTAIQQFKEAAAKAAGDAAASVSGSLAGAGFEKVAGHVIGQAAVTAGSVAVGIATDKAMEKLQVSEKTAALVMKAPSYASSLLTLPNPSAESGGLSLNFDK